MPQDPTILGFSRAVQVSTGSLIPRRLLSPNQTRLMVTLCSNLTPGSLLQENNQRCVLRISYHAFAETLQVSQMSHSKEGAESDHVGTEWAALRTCWRWGEVHKVEGFTPSRISPYEADLYTFTHSAQGHAGSKASQLVKSSLQHSLAK